MQNIFTIIENLRGDHPKQTACTNVTEYRIYVISKLEINSKGILYTFVQCKIYSGSTPRRIRRNSS